MNSDLNKPEIGMRRGEVLIGHSREGEHTLSYVVAIGLPISK